MPPTTAILLTLFSQHQPYEHALKIPCDVVLEVIKSRLDESLSYLEGDKGRLARKEIAAQEEFGSVREMVREVSELMRNETDTPERATL